MARICWILLSAISMPTVQALAEPSPVTFLGSYYQERFTEEHEYRDQIDLWSEGIHVFGLTSRIAGLIGDQVPDLHRFEGTMKGAKLEVSDGFRGTLKGLLLTGTYFGEPESEISLRQSTDKLRSRAATAPRTGYAAWVAWADSVIDRSEARNGYIQWERAKCDSGDGWFCIGMGNRLSYRKPDEAKRYWRRGCELGAWAGCRFLGDSTRCREILLQWCSVTREPSLHRTMACEELGSGAEKAGNTKEAINWYEIGCTPNSLPTGCCNRLKVLRAEK